MMYYFMHIKTTERVKLRNKTMSECIIMKSKDCRFLFLPDSLSFFFFFTFYFFKEFQQHSNQMKSKKKIIDTLFFSLTLKEKPRQEWCNNTRTNTFKADMQDKDGAKQINKIILIKINKIYKH